MKLGSERLLRAGTRGSARLPRHDDREVPTRATRVSPVREKELGFLVCAAAHIVDGGPRNAGVVELQADERCQIAMRLALSALDDLPAPRGELELGGNVLSDLEGTDPDVRTDGDDELGRRMFQPRHGPSDDSGDGAAPSCVHGCNVSTRRMRDEDRDAIRGPRGHREARLANDQGIPFEIRSLGRVVARAYLARMITVNLALLEQPFERDAEGRGKAGSVFTHGCVVVSQMEPQVEGVERRLAHAPDPGRETVPESMSIEQVRT